MDVVDVDALDPEVAPAAVDLIGEVARRHRVTARDDVVGLEDAGPEEVVLHVPARIVRAGAVEGEVSALGAEHDPVPRLSALADGGSHGALAALVAVVDGGVDHVDAELERATD